MNKVFLLLLVALLGSSCGRPDSMDDRSPGKVEVEAGAKVYHLADGVFIQERRDDSTVYFLIESTVAGYELTEEGLDIELDGENEGRYSTTPAPQGYVAAWITEVPGDGPGLTRFQVDEAALAELLEEPTAALTVKDVYDLRR